MEKSVPYSKSPGNSVERNPSAINSKVEIVSVAGCAKARAGSIRKRISDLAEINTELSRRRGNLGNEMGSGSPGYGELKNKCWFQNDLFGEKTLVPASRLIIEGRKNHGKSCKQSDR